MDGVNTILLCSTHTLPTLHLRVAYKYISDYCERMIIPVPLYEADVFNFRWCIFILPHSFQFCISSAVLLVSSLDSYLHALLHFATRTYLAMWNTSASYTGTDMIMRSQ